MLRQHLKRCLKSSSKAKEYLESILKGLCFFCFLSTPYFSGLAVAKLYRYLAVEVKQKGKNIAWKAPSKVFVFMISPLFVIGLAVAKLYGCLAHKIEQ